jgi:hypothetical protein
MFQYLPRLLFNSGLVCACQRISSNIHRNNRRLEQLSNCQRLTYSKDVIKRDNNFQGGGERRGYRVSKMYDKMNEKKNL